MMNEQKKFKKKKEREKVAKQRVMQRRTAMRAFRKEEDAKTKLERELSPRLMPIVNDPLVREMIKKSRTEKANEQIEKNMQLLEALEQQYDAEQAFRKEVNENLEAEGHMTMKDKLDALHQKAIAMQEANKEEANKEVEEKVEEEAPVEA